jgi:hypothetical protein
MSLFSDPITLNDGSADHIFAKRNDLTGMKAGSYGSLWIESAAAQAVSSKMTVKHDESSATVRRRLLQYKYNATIADDETYKPITVNLSLANHPEHTDAQVTVALGVIRDALAEAGFDAAFNDGLS